MAKVELHLAKVTRVQIKADLSDVASREQLPKHFRLEDGPLDPQDPCDS